jgi:hypothetical protein
MAKIIKQRERKTHTEYELCFYEKSTNEVVWGFPLLNGKGRDVVPCKQGKINTYEECTEEECTWWNNYIKAKEDETLYSEEEEKKWSWTEPAIAICECGKEISLDYDAQECEHCGRLHNILGQELLPRHMWEEDYWGEDY